MERTKYRLCGTLRKNDCVELLKNNLTFEEVKSLITPTFNLQLLKILGAFNKKELQYIVLKNDKLTIEKISDRIKKSALDEKNTANSYFMGDEKNETSEEEEDEIINVSENSIIPYTRVEPSRAEPSRAEPSRTEIKSENKPANNIIKKVVIELPKEDNNIKGAKNNSLKKNTHKPSSEYVYTDKLGKIRITDDITSDLNITHITQPPTKSVANVSKGAIPPFEPPTTSGIGEAKKYENIDKIVNYKKAYKILTSEINMTDNEAKQYLQMNADKYKAKYKNGTYASYFTDDKTAEEIYNIVETLVEFNSDMKNNNNTKNSFKSDLFKNQ